MGQQANRNLRTVRRLVAGLAALLTVGFAEANDAAPSVVAKLARTGQVSCEPAIPLFCNNIHVACGGPSTTKTFAFALRANRTSGSIAATGDGADIAEEYENGRVEWDGQNEFVIIRPKQKDGYVKLHADGRYIFRLYAVRGTIMSRGQCN